jgi:hypothetical protein
MDADDESAYNSDTSEDVDWWEEEVSIFYLAPAK